VVVVTAVEPDLIVIEKISQEKDSDSFENLKKTDRRVLAALQRVGSATRSELAQLCTLPRSTVYDVLVRLRLTGSVERHIEPRTQPGHPKVFYQLMIFAGSR